VKPPPALPLPVRFGEPQMSFFPEGVDSSMRRDRGTVGSNDKATDECGPQTGGAERGGRRAKELCCCDEGPACTEWCTPRLTEPPLDGAAVADEERDRALQLD
jgi:hypothetical protein